jgi:hypothetical protein
MPLFEITPNSIKAIAPASLAEMKLRERGDLQRLLRTQIDVIADDLYVLAEEFGEWEDSRRRIDLLAIDKAANLVVIELKRTTDGGHMELQALRYAAMISTMTFERVVALHEEFLRAIGQPPGEARARILDHVGWDEPDEELFADDVRIVLVSEDFSKELTTTVLWLSERDIEIRCVRLRPYTDGDKRLIDVQQIIPLPEANDYQVQLRQKEKQGRKQRAERHDLRQTFWEGIVSLARSNRTRHANIKPGHHQYIGASSGVRGLNLNYVIVQEYGFVELYIDRGDAAENKAIFDKLLAQREAIEKSFGAELSWERLDDKRACRIKHHVELGGYRSPIEQWAPIQSAMLEAMIKLEDSLRAPIDALGLS